MRSFAGQHDTRFRIQAYGQPSAGLFSYINADLPEGEGYQWHDYRADAIRQLGVPSVGRSRQFIRDVHLDSHAAVPRHAAGHQGGGRSSFPAGSESDYLSRLAIYCGGGAAFPAGAFTPPGVFDDQNPWNIVMPDVTRYLQRVSFILRQGVPANDIALYLSNSDAWARFSPGDGSSCCTTQISLTDEVGVCLGHKIVGDILDAGYNLDFFDDGILDARGSVDMAGALIFGAGGRR